MLKKGDRVIWFDRKENEEKHGVVIKGGRVKVTVILDGGEYQVSGSPQCFHIDSTPLPVDRDNPMSKYSLKGFREIPGHDDSLPFICTICYEGKPVCKAMDTGHGGEIEISPVGNTHESFMEYQRNNVHESLHTACR